MTPIPFNKPFITGKETGYLAQAITGPTMAGNGPFTRRCRHWLQDQLGCPGAVLTTSCTAALEMAAILCDIGPGDEVIMPSFTFVSTATAFALRGAVPVFVDIREDTLNIDESLIEAAITPRTRAIVPMHYGGTPCDMHSIMQLGDAQGLRVIEDAAHAIHSSSEGTSLGTIGHLGCLSFHETKNLVSGHGGALLINDEQLIERAEIVWEKGTNRTQFLRGSVDEYTWMDLGSSFSPGELTAAFLCAQLEEADSITGRRRTLYELYRNNLRPLEEAGFVDLPDDLGAQGNGHLVSIITRSRTERDALLKYLNDRDIMALFHYVPLHSSPAGQRYGRTSGSLPVTGRIADCLVRLPMYADLQEQQVVFICEQLRDFFNKGNH